MSVKSSLLAVGLLAALVVGASCGENDSSSATSAKRGNTLAGAADTTKAGGKKQQGELRIPDAPVERPTQNAGAAPAAITPAIVAGTGAPRADLSDVPPAPKEAQWTIYCAAITDPAHVETSRDLKNTLIQQTKMREWYIVHEADRSRLYYGYYRSIDDPADPAESARAKADRKKIDELTNKQNERPFARAQFVQLNAPDPESPPQWDISNAPAGMVWTLIIGAYKDSPERKQAAVDAVREAREKYGEEAYYFHGPVVSNVCIGAWPPDAAIEVRDDPDPNARKNGSGDVFVLPPGVKAPAGMRDKQGRRVSAVSQRLVAVDPKLKAKVEQYPALQVNGAEVVYKTRGGHEQREPSQIVPIPRPGETLFRDNVAAANGGAGSAQGGIDGRGFDQPDPFSRPGVQDNAAVRQQQQPAGGPPQPPAPGQLRSLGKQR